jgi:hypothetical protein
VIARRIPFGILAVAGQNGEFMTHQIGQEQVIGQVQALLEETFEKVAGIYLDRGTSLVETLEAVSAKEASRPAVKGGTSIAGHVAHIRFYLRIVNDVIDGKQYERLDWKQSWLVTTVSESEWDELRQGVRDDYSYLKAHLAQCADWRGEEPLSGALGIAIHTAYHLGAIRQMMKLAR